MASRYLPEEEQKKYKRHLENLRYAASMTETMKFEAEEKIREEGRKEGIKEGMEKGKIEGKIEVAKNLLKTGIDIEIIVKSTGLTKEEIEDLKNE